MSVLATYAANVSAAIRTSMMDRTNFILQLGGMMLNDVFFLALWFMFFAGFRRIGSWGLPDVALLLGLIMTIVGISGVFFGGFRDMAATILRGEIDALLTQPKAVLPRLLARESIANAWGDIIMGSWMLFTFAGLSWHQLPLVLLCLISGATVYISSAVAYASLAFWVAGARSFARDLTDFMLLFSSYPGNVYSGATKFVAYSLLPAGFVVLVPVTFLRSPSPHYFGFLVASALGYAAIAAVSFRLGMRRYRQGKVATG